MRVISDDTLAAMNAWMEARGESFEGQVAVCEVMRNRMKRGKSAVEVILAPYQFSGWNTKDPNRLKALALDDQDPHFQRAMRAWKFSETTNLTHGATLYFNPKAVDAPSWAKPQHRLATVGNHEFYGE